MAMYEWHQIHGFVEGWGMQEHIPDNVIVVEDHTKDAGKYCIPWSIVRHKQEEKVIWAKDSHRFLNVFNIFHMTSEELYDLYDKLEPFLKAEREELLRRYKEQGPAQFTKITLPKINKVWPKLFGDNDESLRSGDSV